MFTVVIGIKMLKRPLKYTSLTVLLELTVWNTSKLQRKKESFTHAEPLCNTIDLSNNEIFIKRSLIGALNRFSCGISALRWPFSSRGTSRADDWTWPLTVPGSVTRTSQRDATLCRWRVERKSTPPPEVGERPLQQMLGVPERKYRGSYLTSIQIVYYSVITAINTVCYSVFEQK